VKREETHVAKGVEGAKSKFPLATMFRYGESNPELPRPIDPQVKLMKGGNVSRYTISDVVVNPAPQIIVVALARIPDDPHLAD
jgi:hypothetical protein